MSARPWLSGAALGALLALAGCNVDETLHPVGGDTTPGPDAGHDAEPPGPPKRTVMLRSPFGGPPESLLVDGDFELSLRGDSGGQYGWLAFNNAGTAAKVVRGETGGLCRSGLRCPVLEPGTIYFLRGAAADHDAGHVLSLLARVPDEKRCTAVQAYAISCDSFEVLKKLGGDGDPDADRWCTLSATVDAQSGPVCMYITSLLTQGTTGLLDGATLLPDEDGQQKPRGEIWVPTASQWHEMRRVRDTLRRKLRFDRGAPLSASAPPRLAPLTASAPPRLAPLTAPAPPRLAPLTASAPPRLAPLAAPAHTTAP